MKRKNQGAPASVRYRREPLSSSRRNESKIASDAIPGNPRQCRRDAPRARGERCRLVPVRGAWCICVENSPATAAVLLQAPPLELIL